jgi:hypothetical protein
MSPTLVTQDHVAKYNYHQLAGTAQVVNLRSASASSYRRKQTWGGKFQAKKIIHLGP